MEAINTSVADGRYRSHAPVPTFRANAAVVVVVREDCLCRMLRSTF